MNIHYTKECSSFLLRWVKKVTEIHRTIKFNHDYNIREYIELNTKNRADANTEAEKDIFFNE